MNAAQAAWGIVRPLPRNAPEYRASWAAAWSTAPANQYFAENAIAYLLMDARGGIIRYLLGTLGVVMVEPEGLRHVKLLHEIFGNPFSPAVIAPSWLTSNVVALAENVCESRDFSSMPVLADALQEAGCEDETVLNHSRQSSEHVLGCWLIDSLLGKE